MNGTEGAPPIPLDARQQIHRIAGLDAIRFVCAAIVALGHFAGNYQADLTPLLGANLARLVDSAIGVNFNGPAAVIVFFVLSGFVVHLPAAEGRAPGLAEYFARRYLRILPPALAAALLYSSFHMASGTDLWLQTVLWSIVCELIYYTLYPLLPRHPRALIYAVPTSFAAAFALIFLNAPAFAANGNYSALEYWTWLLGLPAWLSGCWLAQNYRRFPSVSPARIWMVRLAIQAIAVLLLILRFHAHGLDLFSGYAFTLTLFVVPVVLWLGLEINLRRTRSSPLDRLGAASYSLYLTHPLVFHLLAPAVPEHGFAGLLLFILLAATFAAVFHMGIERPSHWLARKLGGIARKWQSGG